MHKSFAFSVGRGSSQGKRDEARTPEEERVERKWRRRQEHGGPSWKSTHSPEASTWKMASDSSAARLYPSCGGGSWAIDEGHNTRFLSKNLLKPSSWLSRGTR